MTETKKRLLNVMKKLPSEVYEKEEDLEIIMEISKKYYEIYQEKELQVYVEDYLEYKKEMMGKWLKEKKKW